MEKFDNIIIKIGKWICKILWLIIRIVIYFFVGKLAYILFQKFTRDPYHIWLFYYNSKTEIENKIPPIIIKNIAEVLPFERSGEEYFCALLACLVVILIFASITLPRIIDKFCKNFEETSKTIPYLALMMEALIIPILYYININKDFTWWIIKDIILAFSELWILNWFNSICGKYYGWKKYLFVNLIIAICFGVISVFFLYQMFELVVILFFIYLIINMLPIIPFFM